jgi:MFS family permease
VLTLTASLWNLGFSVTETYFSLYVFELGGTETTIGIIRALGSASYVFAIIIGGQIADLYGRKKLLGLMTLISGLSHILLAIAPTWQLLAVAITIVNLCWVAEPAFWAMLADSIDEKHRGIAFSVFSCINFLPWAVMPYLGGFLIDIEGVLSIMRGMYYLLAFLGVTVGILRLLFLEETLPQLGRKGGRARLKSLREIVAEALKAHFRVWLSMPRSVLALAFTYMIWSFEFGLVEPYWIVYAQEEIGLTSTEWGTVIVAGNIVSLLFKLVVVGRVLDKFQRRKVLLAILAFDSFNYILFILCRDFPQTILLWVYASTIWSFYEATYTSIEADLVPKERRGRTYAAFGIAWSAFGIPASIIGGVIYEEVSPQLSFILASIVVLVCLAITIKFLHPPKNNAREP